MWLFSGRTWRKKLGIAGRRARLRWNKYLEDIGKEEMQNYLPWCAVSVRQYSDAFVHVLNSLTLEQERNIWLEKTPRHLDFVDRIENLVERAKFVHIVRNGDEVIASLFHIGKEYSMEWGAGMLKIGQSHLGGAKYQSIDECIHTWVHYIRLSRKICFQAQPLYS